MDWQVEIKLKFRRKPRFLGWKKRNVGFLFEWKAWLIAYDVFNVEPTEFLKLEVEEQLTALIYGGAVWYYVKNGMKLQFDYPELKEALNQATKLQNKEIANTIKQAQFPDWLKSVMPEEDKKKAKSSK